MTTWFERSLSSLARWSGASAPVGRAAACLAASLSAGALPARAQEGTISGVVVAAETQQPLAGAQVLVEGTRRGVATDAAGRFRITGLTANQVPPDFGFDAEFSSISPRRENRVFVNNNRQNVVTVEAPFRALADPRVAVTDLGHVSAANVPLWAQAKHPAANSPIRLASWVEAQLILAEVELQAGDLQAAVDAINRVRTRPGVDLPPVAVGGEAGIRTQLLAERTAEFFLEGHWLGDIRRLDLPLSPAGGATHPLGGTYGDQRCLPLPLNERVNNPNIGG